MSKPDIQDIHNIIEAGSISTLFQPVVSIATRSIIGFEAYSEGRVPGTNRVLVGKDLFREDWDMAAQLQLDRVCREKTLANFVSIFKGHKSQLLFLNVNAATLGAEGAHPQNLLDQVIESGVPPENIVLEAPFSMVRKCPDALVDFYKAQGLGLCIDNLGPDDAFLKALVRINPRFVKINRDFYEPGNSSVFRRRMLQGLLATAEAMSCTVIAQCVETAEESLDLLNSDVHFQQGYYYTKDKDATASAGTDPIKVFFGKIDETYKLFRGQRKKTIGALRVLFQNQARDVSVMAGKLARKTGQEFDAALRFMVNEVAVNSAFVLDANGRQITSRHVAKSAKTLSPVDTAGVGKGVDHSMRDYFLYLELGYDKFVTRPFVSVYTGKPAALTCIPFYDANNRRHILCVEMVHPGQ